MKTTFRNLSMVTFLALSLFSCSNDDDNTIVAGDAPVINDFAYGEGSAHSTEQVAFKGADIHLEAEINAPNVVSSITLEIHAHDLPVAEGETEWDFEQVYTNTNYQVINPTFHEHVAIPSDIPAGEYHISLTVVDELGNSTEAEGHLDILDYITVSDVHIGETAARGGDFHAEFMMEALNGIHQVTVHIHGHDLTVGDGEVAWDAEQVFTEGYHGQTAVEFHEHIDVPATAPVGEYHMTFTIEDEDGNTHQIETHLDVTE